MDSGKVSNDLNLALDVSNQVREKTLDLNTGYIPNENRWELIVKHSGSLDRLKEELNIQVTELLNEYATIIVEESMLERLIQSTEIEFVEKPRRLIFSVAEGKTASCINPVQTAEFNLFGAGVIVAIIDSGIDYSHLDFRNPDGSTRIIYLWDQTIRGTPPEGYTVGNLYTSEQINEALSYPSIPEQLDIVPSVDISGHGTHIACL